MVTIKDVAKRAGVSISTVSYVLNNSKKVSDQTKDKVLSAIKELNYTPNFAGRMLKIKNSNMIGIYFSGLNGYFYGDILMGLRDSILKNNFEPIIISGSKATNLIKQNLFSGIVILDSLFKTKEIYQYLNNNLKVIFLDRIVEMDGLSSSTLDNDKGILLGMDHLYDSGYRNMICLTGPDDSHDSISRINAALKYTKLKNITLEMTAGDFTKKSGYEFAQQFHASWNSKRAVFSFNDEMVLGIYDFYKEIDKNMEDYMDIVSFDNIEVMKYLNKSLATINYSKYNWGAETGQMLIRSIHENQDFHKVIDVDLVVYEGKS